jgi:molybdenum ABC transporter molybdate-binding protein
LIHAALRVSAAAAVTFLLALVGAAPAATGDSLPAPTTLIAFVAANAQDPFNEIVGAYEHDHPGVLVTTEFAGTQVLETQAEQGAPFDIFLSADSKHVDTLQKEGLVGPSVLVSLGHEVIVVPPGDPAGIGSLRDLADKPSKLVLGNDAVPIGIYTRQVLANAAREYGAAFPQQVLSHVVSFETNVKQVLEKVALGEADAGIVYFTDVTPAYAGKVSIIPIPQAYEVEAGNYLAVAAQSKNAQAAADFAAYATGPVGRQIFRRHGYDPLP